jgi:signal-transduction protein with cAMP-binding, CBS, and nucleotidyltransferase domain
VLTEKDYTHKVILQNRNSSATMVKEIMNTDLPVVTVNDTCEKSMEIMNTFKVRYLPVFDGYTFKGVITINDLLEASVEENESAKKSGINKNDSDSSSNSIQHYWI